MTLLKDSEKKPHVILMSDHGAKPNQDGDAIPAIRAALEGAKEFKGEPVEIRFEPGRYPCKGGAITPDGRTHQPSVEMGGFENLTIDGCGATLVGSDIARLFQFKDSRNITLRNLTVDWDPLPHTSGRVVNLVPEQHAFDIVPKIPAQPIAGRIVQAILAYNPDQHRLADNGWEVYQTQGERNADLTHWTAEGTLRIYQSRVYTALPAINQDVVVRHQVYGYDAFVFYTCDNVLIEDVTVYAAPGMAVIGWSCRDVTIRRLKVVPADKGWMSATADAMHFGACRGQITVEDSEFVGMGDDAINIHAMYGLVTARRDNHTLEVGRARMNPYYDTTREIWDAPAPGDILEYSGGDEPLLAQGQLIVTAARQDTELTRTIIQFKEALPASVGENTVLSNLSTSPAIRVRRCRMYSNRARGMLLQSRDVVIEDCIFEDISGAGMHLCTDAEDWWESLGSRDVTVKGCTFRRCNFGVARREAALDIYSVLPQGRQSAAGVHQRLHILGNTFEDNGGAAIHVGSSDGVEVRGNRFAVGDHPAVIVMNSRNVKISGNTLQSGKGGVEIRGSSDPATIQIS